MIGMLSCMQQTHKLDCNDMLCTADAICELEVKTYRWQGSAQMGQHEAAIGRAAVSRENNSR